MAVDDLSDFGVLKTLGYGLNWTPLTGVNLIVSHTNDHAAPTIQQLGSAEIVTPGVRLFDYATGQTVDVTQISGGNPKLVADNRNVFKVGLTLKPFPAENFTVTASYIQVKIDNPIETFPAADAAIEMAFPDRFVRDASGDLTEEDDRPVNFAEQERGEIRWGFNYSHALGPQPQPRFPRGAFRPGGAGDRRRPDTRGVVPPDQATPDATAAAPATPTDGTKPDPNRAAPTTAATTDADARSRGGGAGGGGRGGGGRGGFGGGNGPTAGRLQFALYHTVIFKDQFLVRPGGPTLDLLNGAPASSTGGAPQQEIEAQLGLTLFGAGARLSADWKSGTSVRGGAAATDNLSFSDIGTINFRLFDNLGQQKPVLKLYPWLRGVRVTLNITNLFDQRITVKDAAGITPVSYQSAYLDPAGRTISLSLRKLFY